MAGLSSDPISIMIASDAWGTRILLERCRELTYEQFHQKFPIGLGSLHETLTHIVSVMRRWTDRVADRPVRTALHAVPQFPHLPAEAKDRTAGDLITMLNEAEQDLTATAAAWRDRLDSTVSMEWASGPGVPVRKYTFTRGAVLVHICTHGFHHRAQCLNMMRHLNVPGLSDRLPEPSVTDWQATIEAPPVTKEAAGTGSKT